MKILDKIRYRMYRTSANNINLQEARHILSQDRTAVLIDVRSPQEYNEYHLEGAISLPLYELGSKIFSIVPDKRTLIIVYCQYGGRSKKAEATLKKMGYENVYNIRGGLDNN